jgi:hypothetical protein
MAVQIRVLEAGYEAQINLAAAVATKQLEYAQEVVNLARPGQGNDPVLIAAVLAAIATNYAANRK